MGVADRELLAKLALLMLEELALRRNGRVKPSYWKTYRLAGFWLGRETVRRVLERLVEGGYVKIDGEYVVLLKRFTPQKSLRAVLRDAYSLLATGAPR
ncbi:MAG: hypothetical protein QW086_09230 [Pyrobaculum sp.]